MGETQLKRELGSEAVVILIDRAARGIWAAGKDLMRIPVGTASEILL